MVYRRMSEASSQSVSTHVHVCFFLTWWKVWDCQRAVADTEHRDEATKTWAHFRIYGPALGGVGGPVVQYRSTENNDRPKIQGNIVEIKVRVVVDY